MDLERALNVLRSASKSVSGVTGSESLAQALKDLCAKVKSTREELRDVRAFRRLKANEDALILQTISGTIAKTNLKPN